MIWRKPKAHICATLMICLLTTLSCQKKDQIEVTVAGYITDAYDGSPVAGVEIGGDKRLILEDVSAFEGSTTNAEGYYEMSAILEGTERASRHFTLSYHSPVSHGFICGFESCTDLVIEADGLPVDTTINLVVYKKVPVHLQLEYSIHADSSYYLEYHSILSGDTLIRVSQSPVLQLHPSSELDTIQDDFTHLREQGLQISILGTKFKSSLQIEEENLADGPINVRLDGTELTLE